MIGRRALFLLALLGLGPVASAVEYRSVDVPAAILYDSPSQKGKKLYLIKAQTPVEVVVRLDGWFKIRDAEGSLAWIESRLVSERRTLIVTAPRAELRQADRADAPLLGQLEKWTAVEFVEPASPGWAKVRQRDGGIAYVRANQVWGL